MGDASALHVMLYRPAPIQVTWLGYPNTTGVDCMDYRITDAVCDPVSTTQIYSEKLVRLPTYFICARPWSTSEHGNGILDLQIKSPPILENGYITFGSFNNMMKHSPRQMRTWGKVLLAIPNSRLLVRDKSFFWPFEADRWLQRFLKYAVDPNAAGFNFKTISKLKQRILLRPSVPDHIASIEMYNEMDVMLDSWPYNGTITSTEAILMGVPLITMYLPGEASCHSHNVGASICHQVGLSDLVAASDQEFVEAACHLAADPNRIKELKECLRARALETISKKVPDTICRELEEAYRTMWQDFLACQC